MECIKPNIRRYRNQIRNIYAIRQNNRYRRNDHTDTISGSILPNPAGNACRCRDNFAKQRMVLRRYNGCDISNRRKWPRLYQLDWNRKWLLHRDKPNKLGGNEQSHN